MKYAIAILIYLLTVSSNVNASNSYSTLQENLSNIIENVKSATVTASEINTCQPNCKPGKFSKRK